MEKAKKKVGVGSLSLLLCIVGILFLSSFGDNLLKFIGLRAWSNETNGIHFTIFYSIVFFLPSVIIGYKFKNYLGAMLGKVISLLYLLIIVISIPGLTK